MGIYPSCSCVCIIVRLHQLNFIEVLGEKATGEQYKDSACYFEQIQVAVLHKTATVQPLTSYITNHPSKTSKTCWAMLEKQKLTHKRHSPVDTIVLADQQRLVLRGYRVQLKGPTENNSR